MIHCLSQVVRIALLLHKSIYLYFTRLLAGRQAGRSLQAGREEATPLL